MKKTLWITGILTLFLSTASAQATTTSKFDFEAGAQVIFFDDFAAESVGDFPAQWLTNGSGEIVTSAKYPGRWFNLTKMGYYIPEVKEDLTDNFTVEFDLVPQTTSGTDQLFGLTFLLLPGSLAEPGSGGEPGEAGFLATSDYDNFNWKNWSLATEQHFNGTVAFAFKTGEKYHLAFWVQKQRVRVYANDNKLLDVPRAIPPGCKLTMFRIDTRDEVVPLIGNFRMAAGLPDMRSHLLKEGKVITYGITFDVNSDQLKPDSYTTLKQLSDILKENPALRIRIVGHTDSDGDEAANLDLSKRRAASVKQELTSKFGIESSRLETDGKGESQPIGGNGTSMEKARNRRVEFIKI